ncbi:MAG: 4-hydroxy-3-methylbut-2-enyl diphosphate reductase, partial [Nitrococcus sp.]|nr:4-hydroxy-3-methylbut-2-enyl diphosphate reductase [Nitrococcus sp.]
HGVANAVVQRGRGRDLRIVDATCPLVSKVHRQAQRYRSGGSEIIIIGHGGHPEVKGTRGRVHGPVHVISTPEEVDTLQVQDPQALAYVTQTTLSVDDTREVVAASWVNANRPQVDDICYATQNRQRAIRELATQVEVLLIVGARNSSNSNRLREVGEQVALRSYPVENEDELNPAWFSTCARVGVTAGASAPEFLVQRVLDRLRAFGADSVTELDGVKESKRFRLPWMLG